MTRVFKAITGMPPVRALNTLKLTSSSSWSRLASISDFSAAWSASFDGNFSCSTIFSLAVDFLERDSAQHLAGLGPRFED